MTIRLDTDTAKNEGDLASTRYLGSNAAEATHGYLDTKAGATAEGDATSADASVLDTVYPNPTGNPVAVDPFNRNLGASSIWAGNREVPLTVLHYALGLTEPSAYAQSINSPHLDDKLKAQLTKMYPHMPTKEASAGPKNSATSYLQRGIGARNLLQQSFEQLKAGEITQDQFKQVTAWAFKDDSILDAMAWKGNLHRGYPTVLQSGPSNLISQPSQGKWTTALNMVTGRGPKMTEQAHKQTEYEKPAVGIGIAASLGRMMEFQDTNPAPNPAAVKRLEGLKYFDPELVKYTQEQKHWSDEQRITYALQVLAERDQMQLAGNQAGVDKLKGFVGGLSALPGMVLATAAVSATGLPALGGAVVATIEQKLAATAIGRSALYINGGKALLSNPLATHPYLNSAVHGAASMQAYVSATKAAENLALPSENHGNPLDLELEAMALGAGLGVVGTGIHRGYRRFKSKPTAAGDVIKDIQSNTAPPTDPTNPNLKDTPTPGERVDPAVNAANYQKIIDLVTAPIKDKRARTEEENFEMEGLKADAQVAQRAHQNPAGLQRNLKGYTGNIIHELDKGLPSKAITGDTATGEPALRDRLSIFQDKDGKLPPDLESALLRAELPKNDDGTGDVGIINQKIDAAKTGHLRAKAGAILAHDYNLQSTLARLDSGGVLAPRKAVERFIENPEGGPKIRKLIKGLTEKEQENLKATLEALDTTHPEVAATLREAIAHHEHMSGDLSTPNNQDVLSLLLEKHPDTITELNIPEGKIDLSKVHPDDMEAATRINTLLEQVNQEFPIHHGKTRFKDASDVLRQPNALELINQDPSKGVAFKNADVLDWHKKQLGPEFEHLEDVVFNSETGKFEKFEEKPETTTEPDTHEEPPCS